MQKPYLHSTLRRTVETPLTVDAVLDALEALQSPQMQVVIDPSNAEYPYFEIIVLQNHTEELLFSGIVERWQGTEARVRFEGEVLIPQLSHPKWLLVLNILAGFFFIWMLLDILLMTNYRLMQIVDASIPQMLVFLIGIGAVMGCFFLLNKLNEFVLRKRSEPRWQAQQHLLTIANQIIEAVGLPNG